MRLSSYRLTAEEIQRVSSVVQASKIRWQIIAAVACFALSGSLHAQSASDAGAAGDGGWREIYSVLTHPRCLNCHTTTGYPRQGDDRHQHKFGVVRGLEGKGAPAALCMACHQASNNAASGVPGGPGWHLAPLSMSWESRPGVAMSSAALCLTLKTRAKNGNHSLTELVEHHEKEPLVLWAFEPGTRSDGTPRAAPPMTHEQFAKTFAAWVKAGGPCPGPDKTAAASK